MHPAVSRTRFGGLARAAALSTAAVVLVTGTVVGSAAADPSGSSSDPNAVLRHYKDLARKAEQANEASVAAQVDYDKKAAAKKATQAAVAAAQRDVSTVTAERDALQSRVDSVVRANYEGGRTNRLFALLVSDSPQQMLDQMSTLDFLSRDVANTVRRFAAVKSRALQAQQKAQQATAAATTAAADALEVRDDWARKRAALAMDAARVKAVYDSLTNAQRSALIGPTVPFDPRLVPKGSSPQLVAVQAALSRIGDPYEWGGTGPSQFDCSGLMMWSYQQAGKSLPRTSQAQLAGGQQISRNQLQPGDLVIYYSSASHVGMYIGNGYVVHAPTFGVPVQVVPVDRAGPFDAAVRY